MESVVREHEKRRGKWEGSEGHQLPCRFLQAIIYHRIQMENEGLFEVVLAHVCVFV